MISVSCTPVVGDSTSVHLAAEPLSVLQENLSFGGHLPFLSG